MSRQGGFTLVEMIVAVGMFTILMLIIVGSLLSMSDAARKARNTRIAIDNVSAAMDYMSREIRLGALFHCENDSTVDTPTGAPKTDDPVSCPYGGTGGILLALERAGGNIKVATDQLVFRLNGTAIELSTDSGVTYSALTAPDIQIQTLRFYVDGTNYSVAGSEANQPRVTIVVKGIAGSLKAKTQTTFSLQTTLSARTPNIPPI